MSNNNDSRLSNSPTPPPREYPRDADLDEQYGIAFVDNYLEDNPADFRDDDEPEQPPASSPVSPKTSKTSKGNTNSNEASSSPPRKAKKPAAQPVDVTPTRSSERVKKRKSFADSDETSSSPAKKAKKGAAKPANATPRRRPKRPSGKPTTDSPRDFWAEDFGPNSDAGKKLMRIAAGEPEPIVLTKPNEAKDETPVAEQDQADQPATRPTSSRAQPIMQQIRKKLPKKHTPSKQLSKKQGKLPAVEPTSSETVDEDNDEATPESDNEVEDDDGEPSANSSKSRNAKGKATKKMPETIIPRDYDSKATGDGTTEKPPVGATLDEPWHCANRGCTSGMTWHYRDTVPENPKGPDGKPLPGFGRQAISHFFGRNKKETNAIPKGVWHTYCRKCYQRLKYSADHPSKDSGETREHSQFEWHCRNLKMQLIRLQLWRPDATFKVQLSKNMTERNVEWHATLRRSNNDEAKAKEAFANHAKFGTKDHKANKKGDVRPLNPEEAFPVTMVDDFDKEHCGDGKNYKEVRDVVAAIERMVEEGTISQMPPIEFLVSPKVEGETEHSIAKNYDRWAASVDDREQPPSSDDIEPKEEDADDKGVLDNAEEDAEAEERRASDSLIEAAITSTSDAESASDEDEAEEPPAPPRFKLTPTGKRSRPLSTSYGASKGSGAAIKRKSREYEDDDEGEASAGPSKKAKAKK